MIVPDELKELLGLGDDASVDLVHEVALERGDVGHGLVSTDAPWSDLVAHPNWLELSLGAPVEIAAWQEQDGLFRARLPELFSSYRVCASDRAGNESCSPEVLPPP